MKQFATGLSTSSDALRELLQVSLDCGNPGFVFIDRVNRDCIFGERLNTCNSCAEQFLSPNEGTPLCSINVAALVDDGLIPAEFLATAVSEAIRLLDATIDASAYPSLSAASIARSRRRLGLGVMGLDSALRRMGVPYDSDRAVDMSRHLASQIRAIAMITSAQLASKFGPFNPATLSEPLRRNAGLLAIAPTGGISALWGVSSAIEPIFGRRIAKETVEISVDARGDLPLKSPQDIHWRWHLEHLAAWQAHIDGGISKTVNLPETTKLAEVEALLIDAWRRGVKSLSIFRAGSRPAAIRSL